MGFLLREQVIGAGAVGLAVARQLATRTGTSTILIERHNAVGTETSSRNSEVPNSFFFLHYKKHSSPNPISSLTTAPQWLKEKNNADM